MKSNFEDFFTENDFDIYELHENHELRFLQKINNTKEKKSVFSWKWMSIAASIILFIGFNIGSIHQKQQYDLASVSPKMKEAQEFFVSTINQEIKNIEKQRNTNNENIIDDALSKIKELEEQYDTFKTELRTQENERLIIQRMITNYQQRLTVLENLLNQLESLQKNFNYDEII